MTGPLTTIDYHTGGEPFRIVARPPVDLGGGTVAEKRERAVAGTEVDDLRRILCFEPRGHADMYGGFITPPDDGGADFGVLFWHKDGFSTACGHGTIALGVWAIENGVIAPDASGLSVVTIDVPSGRVQARVRHREREVLGVDFVNVPSYVMAKDVPLETSRGVMSVDIAFGGAIYAQVDANQAGLSVVPTATNDLIAFGREVKQRLEGTKFAKHPSDARLDGIYGTILFEELEDIGSTRAQRNVTVFADGEVDRSPCGSGSCARVATLVAKGGLDVGQTLINQSIVGSRFECVAMGRASSDGYTAVLPRISGMAFKTGSSEFMVDDRDPLVPGFVLR